MTCLYPALPYDLAVSFSFIFFIAVENAKGFGSQRNPVILLTTVSSGPPELQAITGHFMYIASMGTKPKCSLLGVYNRQVEHCNSATRSLSLKDLMNVT